MNHDSLPSPFGPVSRRHFLKAVGATGALISAGGLLSGCDQILSDAGIGFPPLSTPPKLSGDPSKAWWLRGNYAPVMNELEAFDLEVIGSIPPEIDGFFLRNGPNPKNADSDYWLLGDGMLHSVEFAQGRALSYRNRWTQTQALVDGHTSMLSNPANTALVHHGDKLLALYEMGAPYDINLSDLSTGGIYRYGFELEGPMTAHPKLDPATGELFFIGYFPMPPFLRLHRVSPTGTLESSQEIDIPRAVLMHDFQLTENHIIFFDMPMVFDLENVEQSPMPIQYAPQHGSRIGIMPRHGKSDDVVWHTVDTCFMFHSFNAYEDANGRVVVEGSRIGDLWEGGLKAESPLPMGIPWRWTINQTTGSVSEGAMMDIGLDFPTIDHRRQGREHRMNYGLRLTETTPDYPMHPNGVVKHDRQTGGINIWDCGFSTQPDEALFIPDPKDSGDDAGWLMSMIYNRIENCSEVVILDATKVSEGPIARIKMPRRVPFGFHGLWMPRADVA